MASKRRNVANDRGLAEDAAFIAGWAWRLLSAPVRVAERGLRALAREHR